MNDATPGRAVTLADVPVALYREAQQHTDAVLRELVLMAEYEAAREPDGPMRRLFEEADDGFADRLALAVQAGPPVDDAHQRGLGFVTLVFTLPERFAASTRAWARLMERLDALCADGTMLCVPASDEVKAFAQWWCGEFTRQLRDGAAPVPFGSYVATSGSFVA